MNVITQLADDAAIALKLLEALEALAQRPAVKQMLAGWTGANANSPVRPIVENMLNQAEADLENAGTRGK